MCLRILTAGLAVALSIAGLAAGSYLTPPAQAAPLSHAASTTEKVSFSATNYGTITGTLTWVLDCSIQYSLTVTTAAKEPQAKAFFQPGMISSGSPAPEYWAPLNVGSGATYHITGTETDPFIGSTGGCFPWSAVRFDLAHGSSTSGPSAWYRDPLSP